MASPRPRSQCPPPASSSPSGSSPRKPPPPSRELSPTVGFLVAILLLGHLADAEGVFSWLGARLATASRGRPKRMLGPGLAAAAGTTAVLASMLPVVLLTPVVLATAARLRLPERPHVVPGQMTALWLVL